MSGTQFSWKRYRQLSASSRGASNQGGIQWQGTQATNRPTHAILTELSPLTWFFQNTNTTAVSDHSRWETLTEPIWSKCGLIWKISHWLADVQDEMVEWEFGANRVSGPVGCLCPLCLSIPQCTNCSYTLMYADSGIHRIHDLHRFNVPSSSLIQSEAFPDT